jgi:Arc/MetJ-type ribon-helix-helix transcriptional regulator
MHKVEGKIKKITVSVIDKQVEKMDRLIGEGKYSSRSEVIRAALDRM